MRIRRANAAFTGTAIASSPPVRHTHENLARLASFFPPFCAQSEEQVKRWGGGQQGKMMVGLKPSHFESDSPPKITDDSRGRGARRGAVLSALAEEGGWCFVPERSATSAAGSRSCDCAQRNSAVGGNRVSPPSHSS